MTSSIRTMALDHLIVCAGKRVDPGCAEVIQQYVPRQESTRCRFVMREWLTEDQFRAAALLWVTDANASAECVDDALRLGIALLVPASQTGLKQLCHAAGCGLFYHDAAEALRCLEYLVREDAVRCRMAANGYEYWRAPTQAPLAMAVEA